MIFIVGVVHDPTTCYFVSLLTKYQIPFLFADQGKFGLEIHFDSRAVYFQNKYFEYSQFCGVFNRMAGLSKTTSAVRQHHLNEFLIYTIDNHFNIVMNKSVAQNTNFSKPYQLNYLSLHHLKIPESFIFSNCSLMNNQSLIPDYPLIYKSISSSRSIVQRLNMNEDIKRPITAPVLFQECLLGNNIRAHIVGNNVFAQSIKNTEIDYRYSHHNIHFETIELPTHIKEECINATQQCGLLLSGIDLIKLDDNYYILEINPSPGYSFFEKKMKETSITDSIIKSFKENSKGRFC